MSKETLKVSGMSCGHCEKAVENALADIGVSTAKASSGASEVYVEFDQNSVTLEKIKAEIVETGYEVL